jgi:hypothetical protein
METLRKTYTSCTSRPAFKCRCTLQPGVVPCRNSSKTTITQGSQLLYNLTLQSVDNKL